jgi:hypothetical protein
MGSSGGRTYYSPTPPKDWSQLVQASEEETNEKASVTAAESVLQEKLEEINDHDYEGINRHREEIKKKLEAEFEEFDVVLYGGSHSRHTDVNGISDVDVLGVLGDSKNLPPSSKDVIAQVAGVLQERFPNSSLEVGQMAVTIKFSDGIEMQVVPAFRSGSDFLVPDRHSNGWVRTCPTKVSDQITETNKATSGKLVPTIKLAKALCNKEGIDVKSYHLENMALQAFNGYAGKHTLPHMLEHFFNRAKALATQSISDPCGQSADITSHLNDQQRKDLARKFRSVEAKISHAIQSGSATDWEDLL